MALFWWPGVSSAFSGNAVNTRKIIGRPTKHGQGQSPEVIDDGQGVSSQLKWLSFMAVIARPYQNIVQIAPTADPHAASDFGRIFFNASRPKPWSGTSRLEGGRKCVFLTILTLFGGQSLTWAVAEFATYQVQRSRWERGEKQRSSESKHGGRVRKHY